jgi:hypothetical protein
MNNKDLIAQYVDTGLQIPEHQTTQLPGWALNTYIRKRLIATKNKGLSGYEFLLLKDSDKNKYLHNLPQDNFSHLLRNFKTQIKQDNLINYYLENDLLSKDTNVLSMLMQYYSDTDKLINIILEKYINVIGGSVISTIIAESINNSDYVISKILNNKYTLSQIKPQTMVYMLDKSSNPIEIIKLFLSLRKDLNDTEVAAFLLKGKDKYYDEDFVTINFLIYFKDTITDESLRHIIMRSKDGSAMIKIMNKIFGEDRINKVI